MKKNELKNQIRYNESLIDKLIEGLALERRTGRLIRQHCREAVELLCDENKSLQLLVKEKDQNYNKLLKLYVDLKERSIILEQH